MALTLEFSHEQYKELKLYSKEIRIFFTASGMNEVGTLPVVGGSFRVGEGGRSGTHIGVQS